MKRQSQRIPTIRKQYVQTIYDGLASQFDKTIKNELNDQVQKVQTLKDVFQSSIQAQSSIISFLMKTIADKFVISKQQVAQFKQHLNELQFSQDKQRKSVLISSLNQKMQQNGLAINLLSKSIQQLKEENENINNKLVQTLEEKKKSQHDLLQQINEKQKKLQQLLQQLRKYKQTKITEPQKAINNAQQNEQFKTKLEQYKLKIKQYENEKQQNMQKYLNLLKKMQSTQKQNEELRQFKKVSENVMASMEQQMKIVAKFTNYQSEKTKQLKQKLSQRQNISKEQLEKLKQIAEQEESKRVAKQMESKKLSRHSDSIQNGTQLPTLSKISQKQDESRLSENSISNDMNSQKQVKAGGSLTEKKINKKQENADIFSQQQFSTQSTHKNETNRINELNLFTLVRQCVSQKTQSIQQSEESRVVDHQIDELKLILQKRPASVRSISDSNEETEQATEQTENKTRKISQQLNQMMATQSKHTSLIINILGQNRIASVQYQSQLEEQIAALNQRLQTEALRYNLHINEQNQKIDELMSKIEQFQEQRVRGVTGYQSVMEEKVHTIDMLCAQVEKLRQQNNDFAEVCELSKKQLQNERSIVENLQDQIKQLNTEKQKMINEKHQLENQIKFQDQLKHQFNVQMQAKNNQIQQLKMKISRLIENNEQIGCKFQIGQSARQSLQINLLGYQKCIDELETKISNKNEQQRNYLDQIERLKKIISDLNIKVQEIQNQLNFMKQDYEKIVCDKKTLQKNNEDLKYMNSLLKKDVMKVKQIEEKDYDKQCSDNSTLKISKIGNILSTREQETIQPRAKNYSFTSSGSKDFQNSIKWGANKVTQLNLKSINLPAPGKQNNLCLSGRLNKSKDLPLSIKLDLGFTNKKTSFFAKENYDSYQSQTLTDRPFTETIKKKYKLG